MTQDKMRKLIAAVTSAATVLIVVLLSVLIYQWVSMSSYNKRIENVKADIATLEEQIASAKEDAEFYESKAYLKWQLDELKLKLDILQNKG